MMIIPLTLWLHESFQTPIFGSPISEYLIGRSSWALSTKWNRQPIDNSNHLRDLDAYFCICSKQISAIKTHIKSWQKKTVTNALPISVLFCKLYCFDFIARFRWQIPHNHANLAPLVGYLNEYFSIFVMKFRF